MEQFNSKFFENKDCEYYPCHENMEEINCLFCYCPLFSYCPNCDGEKCEYNHKRESYDKIIETLAKNVKENKCQ